MSFCASSRLMKGLSGKDVRLPRPGNDVLSNFHGSYSSQCRDIVHEIQHDLFQDRAQRPRFGFHLSRATTDRLHRGIGKPELDPFDLEERLILLYQGVARFGEDTNERWNIQV